MAEKKKATITLSKVMEQIKSVPGQTRAERVCKCIDHAGKDGDLKLILQDKGEMYFVYK